MAKLTGNDEEGNVYQEKADELGHRTQTAWAGQTQLDLRQELFIWTAKSANAFRNARGIRVRRADPYQLTREPCTYCQTNFGYDYYIQPTSPKATYFKKGRFDDEIDCA